MLLTPNTNSLVIFEFYNSAFLSATSLLKYAHYSFLYRLDWLALLIPCCYCLSILLQFVSVVKHFVCTASTSFPLLLQFRYIKLMCVICKALSTHHLQLGELSCIVCYSSNIVQQLTFFVKHFVVCWNLLFTAHFQHVAIVHTSNKFVKHYLL